MKKTILLLLFSLQALSQKLYDEPYRPQFHFSPKKNWTNDPNGMVYFGGEYHLFFQYNPYGDKWGHMTWGHAVSADLTHWKELEPAILEENDTMIFSGCVVVDSMNSSGFGDKKNIPLVAIYTGHEEGKRQTQQLAFSLDKGRTWKKYDQNPVIDLNQKDFRDPNVIWYAPLKVWLMTVSLPHEQRVLFYHSKNLKDWEQVGNFQIKNPEMGIWECPALMEIETNKIKKWVMLVSLGSGAPFGGTGMQYFVGDFDGKKFMPQDTKIRWFDYGKDCYAAIPFNNLKTPIMLGWMNNWQYANEIPTAPFRGQMTLPRVLSLKQSQNIFTLSQAPIIQISGTIPTFYGNTEALKKIFKDYETDKDIFEFEVPTAEVGMSVRVGKNEETKIGYDPIKKELYVDRVKSGNVAFHKDFSARTSAPLLPNKDGKIKIMVVLDRCSVEVFGNDGEVALTNLIFPDPKSKKIRFWGNGFKEVRQNKQISSWK